LKIKAKLDTGNPVTGVKITNWEDLMAVLNFRNITSWAEDNHPSRKEAYHDQKHYLCMPDRFCSHLCCSKYPGGRVPISGMDDINVTRINAVRYAGDRIYCRLAIDHAEA
jgi:hypothetical protein